MGLELGLFVFADKSEEEKKNGREEKKCLKSCNLYSSVMFWFSLDGL